MPLKYQLVRKESKMDPGAQVWVKNKKIRTDKQGSVAGLYWNTQTDKKNNAPEIGRDVKEWESCNKQLFPEF